MASLYIFFYVIHAEIPINYIKASETVPKNVTGILHILFSIPYNKTVHNETEEIYNINLTHPNVVTEINY